MRKPIVLEHGAIVDHMLGRVDIHRIQSMQDATATKDA
jgi:hypothetical protein